MNSDVDYMQRAIELAGRGEGRVEPNPMVGCVIVRDQQIISEGWHARFGGPHAEVVAMSEAGDRASGATMYVTLEPCCHQGKTPPCTEAIVRAGIRRVVVAQIDPFPEVAGQGVQWLRKAGIDVETGLCEDMAHRVNAPYRMLLLNERPWMMGKWAMTLDGKIASRAGHSRWISGEASRQIVHRLRGRVDAVVVGRRTAERDDPLLTARPKALRVATRVVFDSRAALPLGSRLVRSCREAPVLVVAGPEAPESSCSRLTEAGCEVLQCPVADPAQRLEQAIHVLGQRRMTNVLVEGGGRLLGSLFDLRLLDEVHVFIAPKLVGGQGAPGPIAGLGLDRVPELPTLCDRRIEVVEQDVYITGRLHNDPTNDAGGH